MSLEKSWRDEFWNTDISDLPWALKIDENTQIVDSVWWVPIKNVKVTSGLIEENSTVRRFEWIIGDIIANIRK